MTDATVVTNSLNNVIDVADTSAVSNTAVVGTENLTKEIETTSNLNDALDTLFNVVGPNGVTSIELAEGALFGATSATVGANGVTNVVTKENVSNAGLVDMTALSFMAWRGENDDLNERLGNLRNAREDHGIWTRMSRAQQSYNSVSNQYSMYQIGYDQQAGDWTIGAAYSYTDGKSWFAEGTGENTHNVFSLYGTKMNDNGTFSNGTNSVDISRDLGGGWWKVGFGANFDLSDATHLYLDFEKAIAGEVDVEWKWNAGVRYSF
ncbi:MAG: autotransporter outer membrane beta-barrel domain-containing protein [Selenomonadales bacterium]|nr:autotransporter outer membrane beta-barrel domain-containing protein [Selenomonadales bacterium]